LNKAKGSSPFFRCTDGSFLRWLFSGDAQRYLGNTVRLRRLSVETGMGKRGKRGKRRN
jgi:hypothetical protein